jgi:hypothetical protein
LPDLWCPSFFLPPFLCPEDSWKWASPSSKLNRHQLNMLIKFSTFKRNFFRHYSPFIAILIKELFLLLEVV